MSATPIGLRQASSRMVAAQLTGKQKLVKFLHLGADGRISLYRRLKRFAERGRDEKFALAPMQRRFASKKDERAVVWADWLRLLSGGVQFSAVISPYVPPTEALAISAGEETGARPEGYAMAEYIATSAKNIQSAVRGALTYPLVLLLMLVALLVFAGLYLIPAMLTIGPLEKWPAIPHALHTTTAFILSWGWLVGLVVAAVATWVVRSLPRMRGNTRAFLDKHVLPWSAYRVIQGGNLLVVIAALSNAGHPLDESVRRIRRISTPWLKWHLDRMLALLVDGRTPSVAINTGILDEEIAGDLEDYDHAGAFTDALQEVGRDVVEATITRITRQATVVRYLLMLVFVAGLLWIYGSLGLLVMSLRGSMH